MKKETKQAIKTIAYRSAVQSIALFIVLVFFSVLFNTVGLEIDVTYGKENNNNFVVQGTSMYPTLNNGELIETELIANEDVSEDDIIVFSTDDISYNMNAIKDNSEYNSCNIKQDIDKGDCVLENIITSNEPHDDLEEEYLVKRVIYIEDINDDGYDDFYVRGDNRINSVDSKDFGFVYGSEEEHIVIE